MRVVVALGGNALARRGEPLDAGLQRQRAAAAAEGIAAVAAVHDVVVAHGNGPQVGLLALQAAAFRDVESYPLDVLNAESQGMIGYWLLQALGGALPGREVACLLTQVEVDPKDSAWQLASKPIGPVYSGAEAHERAARHGWTIAADGDGYRRVVPSPRPLRVLGIATVRRLLDAGVLVICGGGGGVPVIGVDGTVCGVEAVVDKDHTAALLARSVGARRLLIATDVDGVYESWPQRDGGPLSTLSPSAAARLDLEPGSMAPKVAAAVSFARAGGTATIGRLEDLPELMAGQAGTTVAA